MTLLSRYLRPSLVSRMKTAAPLAAVVPRSFTTSFQSSRVDLMKQAPGWDASNATESEADVKADRERLTNMKQLQEDSAQYAREHQPVKIVTVEASPILGMDIAVEEVVDDFARRAQQTSDEKLDKVEKKLESFEENIEGSPIFGYL
ncbi:hypothetical protein BGZ80_009523 [Entomortierella chlamydospora]|uniref:Uncharacterized protein n=1 Tax=Entomortierella chlamydospora TaxID=101097 RepID=A0A9P6T439_9FUNG|nr:hypothetical protein BGZ79_005950 [Entomortierella chlamydospora]KAG0023399.1 hypothetical protein BGZ80_009523 [Entomortierella chlamydospora]